MYTGEFSIHCAICDKDDDLITFDKVEGKFSPCGECQESIQDCLDGYDHADAVLSVLLLEEDE